MDKKMKEYQLQKAVCKYLDLQGYLYCSTMGGQYQKYHSQRNKAKATGYKKGIPDIIIYEPIKKYESENEYWHGLAIELKTKTGRPTAEQVEWIKQLQKRGYMASICKGIDEALELINNYIKNKI